MGGQGGDAGLGDPQRLAALRHAGLMDSPAEEAFDRLTRLAARVLHAPVSLVSLVDDNRQFFKSQTGLAEPWSSQRQTALSHSLCQYTVSSGQPLVVEDARSDPRVSSNRAVSDLGVVAYAGMPLTTETGQVLGSLCVIDHKPRAWTADELGLLGDLAAAVMAEITLHRLAREAALQARRAEDAQRRAEALAAERAAVLAQVKEGVIVADAEGHITFVNDEARRLHGQAVLNVGVEEYATTYRLYTLAGEPYPPRDLPLSRAVVRGETVVDAEWRIRRADGSEAIARGSATPVVGEDGRRLGSVLILHDVTAEHDLQREKEDFLAAAAHDLKNPLILIKGTAQLLRRQAARAQAPDPQRLERGLHTIDVASTAMANLVDELLEITRADVGHPGTLHRRPTNLVTLTHQVVDRYRHTSERHTLRVVAAQAEVRGHWDAARLERVLGNLLGNAIKYSPLGGDIVLTVSCEKTESGPRAVLAVTDHGVGIPEADQAHVFERFRRGNNVVGTIAGTGIGLAAARQAVDDHGGTITIASREGEGTTVTMRLPLGET
ncbi:MAG: hypothetical protein NVSMB65_06250 [Chloroflexota bacterium]